MGPQAGERSSRRAGWQELQPRGRSGLSPTQGLRTDLVWSRGSLRLWACKASPANSARWRLPQRATRKATCGPPYAAPGPDGAPQQGGAGWRGRKLHSGLWSSEPRHCRHAWEEQIQILLERTPTRGLRKAIKVLGVVYEEAHSRILRLCFPRGHRCAGTAVTACDVNLVRVPGRQTKLTLFYTS